MKCKFCREEVPDGAKFCPVCGEPVDIKEEEGDNYKKTAPEEFWQYNFGKQDPNRQEGYSYGQQGSDGQNYSYGQQGSDGQNYSYGQQGSDGQGYSYGQQGSDGQGYSYGQQGSDGQNYSYGQQDPNRQGYNYDQNNGYSGQPYPAGQQKPINGTLYLILSILATLVCCLPLGIIGIYFSSRINSMQRRGDYEGARSSAKIARIMLIICLVLGLISAVAAVGISAYGAMTDSSSLSSLEDVIDDDSDSDAKDDGLSGDLDGIVDHTVTAAAKVDQLGDNWDSYTFQIGDKVFALPCEYTELAELGFTPDADMMEDDDDGTVDGQEYEMIYLKDGNGNSVMADIINPDETDKKYEDCLIAGITVGDYRIEDLSVSFPGDIRIGSTVDDVVAKYGDAGDVYEGDSLDMYTWMDQNAYYSALEADFDAESGKLSQICLRNYGF